MNNTHGSSYLELLEILNVLDAIGVFTDGELQTIAAPLPVAPALNERIIGEAFVRRWLYEQRCPPAITVITEREDGLTEIEKQFQQYLIPIRRSQEFRENLATAESLKFSSDRDRHIWQWITGRVRDFIDCHAIFPIVLGGRNEAIPIPFRVRGDSQNKVVDRGGTNLEPWTACLEKLNSEIGVGCAVEILCNFGKRAEKLSGESLILSLLLAWRRRYFDFGDFIPLAILCSGAMEAELLKGVSGIEAKRELAERLGAALFVFPGSGSNGAHELAIRPSTTMDDCLKAMQMELTSRGLLHLSFEQTCRRVEEIHADIGADHNELDCNPDRRRRFGNQLNRYFYSLINFASRTSKILLIDIPLIYLRILFCFHRKLVLSSSAVLFLSLMAYVGYTLNLFTPQDPMWQTIGQIGKQLPKPGGKSKVVEIKYEKENVRIKVTRYDDCNYAWELEGSDSAPLLSTPFTMEEFVTAMQKFGVTIPFRLMVKEIDFQRREFSGFKKYFEEIFKTRKIDISRIPRHLQNSPYKHQEFPFLLQFLTVASFLGDCKEKDIIDLKIADNPFLLDDKKIEYKEFQKRLENQVFTPKQFEDLGGDFYECFIYESLKPNSLLKYELHFRTRLEMILAITMESDTFAALQKNDKWVLDDIPEAERHPVIDFKNKSEYSYPLDCVRSLLKGQLK